jgi:hypothetical protein
MRFSPNTLGNLIYRTRLKLAASMLHFDGYDDFEDYLGPRWHCYLSDIIATIPMPLRFARGDFESGLAARLLSEYAADPYPYLDEAAKKKIAIVQSDLLRKFDHFALDESAQARYNEFARTEAHSGDKKSAGRKAPQDEILKSSGGLFLIIEGV